MLVLLEDADHCVEARTPRLTERMLAHLLSARLDRALAAGVPAEASVPLALRASYLVRPRTRSALARSLRRLVSRASGSDPRGIPVVPVQGPAVRGNAPGLRRLADSLQRRGPVPARGVAQANLLLTDGAGPLYRAGNGEALAVAVATALSSLEPLSGW